MRMIDSDQLHVILIDAYNDAQEYTRRANIVYLEYFESLTLAEKGDLTFEVNKAITDEVILNAFKRILQDTLMTKRNESATKANSL